MQDTKLLQSIAYYKLKEVKNTGSPIKTFDFYVFYLCLGWYVSALSLLLLPEAGLRLSEK